MALLKAEHMSFRHASADAFCLQDISFEIEKGEFILLFGETGCGKSTLLKQWKPSICPAGECKGRLCYQNEEVRCMDQRMEATQIGYVSQNPDNQIVTDKVWHELAFTLENLGIPSDEIRKRVAEIAVFFGITSWFHKSVKELSGGQKQILNLASVMIARPELLLLDEPTSQLDPIATENFMNLLKRIHMELGTTIILAEHRLEEAYPKADRCMVLKAGELICLATPDKTTEFLYQHRNIQEPSAFELLPFQVRLPALLKKNFSTRTIGEAIRFVENNLLGGSRIVDSVPETNGESILRFQNVWFRYEKNGLDVLRDFSLDIKRGDFLAIVGANGQGKSTFLQLAVNILKPYRGKIKKKEKIVVSMLPQNPQVLFTKNTVEEELLSITENIEDIIKKMELENVLKKHPYDLSGGQQQMTALAKVLLTKPDILLLDEPTKGVDQVMKQKLGALFKRLNQEGITIILVSHDVDFCAAYAKAAGMIFDGVISSIGEVHSFFTEQYFFTTTCQKICRSHYKGMITEQEVLSYEQLKMG